MAYRELVMFQELYKWIDCSLKEDLPEEIQAFCFNLVENGGKFSVELIGAASFDESDEDWACDEIFEPKERSIYIPEVVSGKNWEACQKSMTNLIEAYLSSNAPGASILNKSKGIGIGFVDGDLSLLTSHNK